MKFFENLPKTSFETTIGTFEISDFFTYLDVENAPIQESNISIDSKTTLLEAAATTYEDPDSFWAIVAANNVINPFTLVESNVNIFTNANKNNTCFILCNQPYFLTPSNGFKSAPIGSLIFPYVSNDAFPAFSYGSTGYYDMNGPMAVIVDSSYYDLTITASVVKGGNDFLSTPSALARTIIPLNSDGTYGEPFYKFIISSQTANNKVVKQVNKTDGKTIYKNTKDFIQSPTLDTLLPQSTPLDGATLYTAYTAQQEITVASKNIQAYVPKQLGLIQSSFVATKYK
jgi:hypothetical protein